MSKKTIWKVLFFMSFIPFVLPLILGIYHTMIESWELLDWIILYSLPETTFLNLFFLEIEYEMY